MNVGSSCFYRRNLADISLKCMVYYCSKLVYVAELAACDALQCNPVSGTKAL